MFLSNPHLSRHLQHFPYCIHLSRHLQHFAYLYPVETFAGMSRMGGLCNGVEKVVEGYDSGGRTAGTRQ